MKKNLPAISGVLWSLSFILTLGLSPLHELERMAAVLVCLASLGLLALGGRGLEFRPVVAARVAFPVLLIWLLVTISAAWSVAPSLSLLYAGTFAVLPATILAVLFAREEARTRFLSIASWMTGLIVAGLSLWALAQVFLLPEFLVQGQVRHPFANPNAFAALLNLALFAGLGLLLRNPDKITRVFLMAGLFLTGSALAAIASQAATLTLIAGMGLAIVLTRRDIRPAQAKTLASVALTVAAMGIAMAMLPDKTDIVSRLARLGGGDGGMNSWQNRLDIWRATLSLIADHPVLGTGYRTFSLMYPSMRLPSETYSGGFMAHSDPLQFWAETGIAGPVLFYAIGVMVAMRFVKWLRSGERDALPIFLFCGCAVFIAHAHVDFLLYTMPDSMMFALALGGLLVLTQRPEEEVAMPLSFTSAWPASARGLALIAPVAALMMIFAPLMLAEHYTARAQAFIRAGDMDGFGRAVNAANRAGQGMTARPYVMAAIVPLSLLRNDAAGMTAEEQRTIFRQIDGLLSKALARNSRFAAAWHHRGEMVAALGPSILPDSYPSAEECFKKALSLDPLYLPARRALAQVYIRKEDEAAALDVLAGGLRWPYPTFDAMPYYEETEALAKKLGHPDIVQTVAKVRVVHLNRVQRSARRREALAELIQP
jgi:O-antigen ligase